MDVLGGGGVSVSMYVCLSVCFCGTPKVKEALDSTGSERPIKYTDKIPYDKSAR